MSHLRPVSFSVIDHFICPQILHVINLAFPIRCLVGTSSGGNVGTHRLRQLNSLGRGKTNGRLRESGRDSLFRRPSSRRHHKALFVQVIAARSSGYQFMNLRQDMLGEVVCGTEETGWCNRSMGLEWCGPTHKGRDEAIHLCTWRDKHAQNPHIFLQNNAYIFFSKRATSLTQTAIKYFKSWTSSGSGSSCGSTTQHQELVAGAQLPKLCTGEVSSSARENCLVGSQSWKHLEADMSVMVLCFENKRYIGRYICANLKYYPSTSQLVTMTTKLWAKKDTQAVHVKISNKPCFMGCLHLNSCQKSFAGISLERRKHVWIINADSMHLHTFLPVTRNIRLPRKQTGPNTWHQPNAKQRHLPKGDQQALWSSSHFALPRCLPRLLHILQRPLLVHRGDRCSKFHKARCRHKPAAVQHQIWSCEHDLTSKDHFQVSNPSETYCHAKRRREETVHYNRSQALHAFWVQWKTTKPVQAKALANNTNCKCIAKTKITPA